jgi:hypothetical protein
VWWNGALAMFFGNECFCLMEWYSGTFIMFKVFHLLLPFDGAELAPFGHPAFVGTNQYPVTSVQNQYLVHPASHMMACTEAKLEVCSCV